MNDTMLTSVNTALDGVLQLRVELHQARSQGQITVPEYIAGLAAARDAERALEALRQGLPSRAAELSADELLRRIAT